MSSPIVFNNTVYPAGYSAAEPGGSSSTFTARSLSPFAIAINGTVSKPGDRVTITFDYGAPSATDRTFIATSYDNSGNIEFLGINRGEVVRYIFSNSPIERGDVVTFNEQELGDYSPVCYCAGTLIRTIAGDVPVENLTIGDTVVTDSGAERPIKWIGTRSYAGRFANTNPDVLPVCFKAGSLAEGVPARDLWVSPKHAMVLDGVLIPAQHLVNGVSIVKAERVESVTYFHVELDSHDVLIAEGAASESFVDDNGRGIFHNAHEFHALYPDARPVEAVYCAPRVEDGYVLEAVRRRLAERAGLRVMPGEGFGLLRGCVEGSATDGEGLRVWGWAQDAAYPDAPVCLELLVDGAVTLAYADAYRGDLAAAGIGDGCHGFCLSLPVPLVRDKAHVIAVRRSGDGAALTDLRATGVREAA